MHAEAWRPATLALTLTLARANEGSRAVIRFCPCGSCDPEEAPALCCLGIIRQQPLMDLSFDGCCEHAVPHSNINITSSCFCLQHNLLIFPLLKNTSEKCPERSDSTEGPDTHLLVFRASGSPWHPERLWRERRSEVILSGGVLQVPLP